MPRRPIIGVIGGGEAKVSKDSPTYNLAKEVGKEIANAGAILLCGGGKGVMEAAARGARSVRGHTIGIMPKMEGEDEPNDYIDRAIYTGLRHGRNYINAKASDALIALDGGAGTLSEIALGLKTKTPVIILDAWSFLRTKFSKIVLASNPRDAVDKAYARMNCLRGGQIDQNLSFPLMDSQLEQKTKFEEIVRKWSEI